MFSAPTRRRRLRLLRLPAPAAAVAAVAACGALAACGAGAAGGTGSGPALTLYSGQHPQTTQALVKAFTDNTGITVNVRSDDEDALANQIATEGTRSPADLFFTENTPPLELLQGAPRDPGYVIDVSGVGILKSSKHQAQDQKFVAFLLSPAAQQIIGNPQKSISYEYPIASGVTGRDGETPLSQLQPDSISPGDLGDGSAAIALMHQAGLL